MLSNFSKRLRTRPSIQNLFWEFWRTKGIYQRLVRRTDSGLLPYLSDSGLPSSFLGMSTPRWPSLCWGLPLSLIVTPWIKVLPEETLKTHLVGFNFILYLQNVLNVSLRSSRCSSLTLLFTNIEFHVEFHILPYLVRKHPVYQPLVCGSSVFQIEGHDLVIV